MREQCWREKKPRDNFFTSNSLMNVQTSGTNEFILTFKLNRKAKGHDNGFIKNSKVYNNYFIKLYIFLIKEINY